MSTVRIGIIGIGSFGYRHALCFQDHPRANIVCVCSRTEETARTKATSLHCDFTTDYHALLSRADIDAVVVGTPNMLHYQMSLDALEAGKHVTVEYPITQTTEQFDALCTKAREQGLVLHHSFTPIVEPQPLAIRDHITDIGKVLTIRSFYVGGCGGREWYKDPALRGSFFSSLTIHMIAYQKVILDENPSWVFAAYKAYDEDDSSMQSGSFFCQYPSGVLAYNEWGMGFGNRKWEWAIEGSRGRISYHPNHPSPHYLKVTTADGETTVEIAPQGEGVKKDVSNFLDRILNGSSPYASDACTRDMIAVCEAADKSAQTAQRIGMDYS